MSEDYISTYIAALKKPSILLLLFTLCFMFWFNDLLKPYIPQRNETNFVWDASSYYSYLPSAFYYHGSFEFFNGYENFMPYTRQGKHYPKYTYGVALLESPFYFIAYFKAFLSGQSMEGFNSSFAEAIRWGGFLYVLTGLFFLRKFLLHFFNEAVTTLTLFGVLFGSMLFVYTFSECEISHAYLFFLFSLLLYFTLKWHQKPGYFYSLCLAVTLAIISIVRFTDIYIFLFFIFWDIKKPADINRKLKLFLKQFRHIILFPLVGFLFWIPQFIFWKHYLGSYLYDPYINEFFYWKDPQILNILFSYRKGWITYTPIVLLALAGIFFIKKDVPLSRLSFVFVVALTVYVFSCWWDWNYGGCFGNRAFCPLIAPLAIPIASLLERVLYQSFFPLIKQWCAAVVLFFVFSCVFLNMGQTYQYEEQQIIHGYNMSKPLYWGSFRQFHYGAEFINPYMQNQHERNFDFWTQGIDRDDTK